MLLSSVFPVDSVAGLEKANGRIRDRAKMLLEKSDSDDRLVDALRNEIQVSDANHVTLVQVDLWMYIRRVDLNMWGTRVHSCMRSVGGAREPCSRADSPRL